MPRLSLFGRCREHGIRCIENIKFLYIRSGNAHLPAAKTLQNFPNPAAKGCSRSCTAICSVHDRCIDILCTLRKTAYMAAFVSSRCSASGCATSSRCTAEPAPLVHCSIRGAATRDCSGAGPAAGGSSRRSQRLFWSRPLLCSTRQRAGQIMAAVAAERQSVSGRLDEFRQQNK